tara:strand:- start:1451 stop:1615 length:165 start_codon:yes stop_codon:yes gene_type:complete
VLKNIAYFSSIVWSLLCLLASDFPAENPRTQTHNVPYTKPLCAMPKQTVENLTD